MYFSAVTSGIKEIREVMKGPKATGFTANRHAHDAREKLTNMECLPESLRGRSYYHSTREGLEGRFVQRLKEIKAWNRKHEKT